MKKTKFKTMAEREMEDPAFRKHFEDTWDAFQIEVQMLNALEKKHWSYTDLAKLVGTDRSHVSRDLKGGGMRSATISRITKMAEALGMKFVPILISRKKEKDLLPKIHRLVAA
jgi:transcriptional regulator with XRE-family HTH domain